MNFKKPTALTTALSALLVLGIGSTAAFAVAPKIEDSVTVSEPESVVSTSEPIVTTSEPVLGNEPTSDTALDNDTTGNDPEIGEPEPIDLEEELESKYPRGEHSIPIFPEDKNGIYYSESGDVVRVPIHVLEFSKLPSCGFGRTDRNDKGTLYAHAVIYKERPEGYNSVVYWGDEFAVLTRNDSISNEQYDIYNQMKDDGIIPCSRDCFHDLNSLD